MERPKRVRMVVVDEQLDAYEVEVDGECKTTSKDLHNMVIWIGGFPHGDPVVLVCGEPDAMTEKLLMASHNYKLSVE